MKTLISFLLLVSFGGLCSCELISNNEPKTELEKLPPITQEGKNTFGYLVNGEAIVVRNTMNITAIYQQDNLMEVKKESGKFTVNIFIPLQKTLA